MSSPGKCILVRGYLAELLFFDFPEDVRHAGLDAVEGALQLICPFCVGLGALFPGELFHVEDGLMVIEIA